MLVIFDKNLKLVHALVVRHIDVEKTVAVAEKFNQKSFITFTHDEYDTPCFMEQGTTTNSDVHKFLNKHRGYTGQWWL